MTKPILSIVVPSINPNTWIALYQSVKNGLTNHTWEIIFVGPYGLPSELDAISNIKYVRDFGSPSRAMQIGSMLAEGKLLMWMVDEGLLEPDMMDDCVGRMLNSNNRTILNLLHSEGLDYTTDKGDPRLTCDIEAEDNFFRAWHHDDLKIEGIDKSWYGFPMFMIHTIYYYKLGGLDCQYEHVNFNICDMLFRAQRDNCTIIHSDQNKPFSRIPHNANRTMDHPIVACHFSDRKRIENAYVSKEFVKNSPISIDINNWKYVESVWHRRWTIS
jgi:hypothetical protein